ncbi:MAG: glycoside hydrolase family 6 protein [Candidatus Melainabacteria bacterium]|nr:glycoside hydrolase family 6 protein [Candidatus Melainabacteria bacterium]
MSLKKLLLKLTLLSGLLALLGVGTSFLAQPGKVPTFVPYWSRSYQLYRQPHAIWLAEDNQVGANLPQLQRVLILAEKSRQQPEVVVYAIPLRDLGQSSEGGFKTREDYWAENQLLAEAIRGFVQKTAIAPRVYLEPDNLPLAIQYKKDTQNSPDSVRVYEERLSLSRRLVQLYQKAGALVYLDAGNSKWFDYSDEDIEAMAQALNGAGIQQADGLTTNISNRQPAVGSAIPQTEQHYLSRLLPKLQNRTLDVVVDTSRNGGQTVPREFFLAEDGRLIDNQTPNGREIGFWKKDPQGELWFHSYFGPPKRLSRLLNKEKYTFHPEKKLLSAPPWLDPIGDVKLGPPPTDAPQATYISRFRYIKPPDDCDGSLNCPPGQSKTDIIQFTQRLQRRPAAISQSVWTPIPTSVTLEKPSLPANPAAQ